MTTTDLDLQRRCAELAGWADVNVKSGKLVGLPPGGPKSRGWSTIPEYPHDMNAAMELLNLIVARSRLDGSVEIHRSSDNQWLVLFQRWEKAVSCKDENLATAICRAFVEVMGDD